MTMKLTVRNEDSQRTAVVRTHDFNPSTPEASAIASVTEILPGETAELWIHSGRKIEVLEKSDVFHAAPEPPPTPPQ